MILCTANPTAAVCARGSHAVTSVGLLVWLSSLASLPPAHGHEVFTGFVQHQLRLVAGARHLDVTLDLTFFEDGSEHEREHLDADGDGRIRRPEIDAYLRQLEPALPEKVRLVVAGQRVPLLSLDAPRLDLLGNDRTGRGHHRLSVFLFAPTPAGLKPGDEVVIEDRLWPDLRALGALAVEGKDGARFEVRAPADPFFPPARPGEARRFTARLLQPPRMPVPSPPTIVPPKDPSRP